MLARSILVITAVAGLTAGLAAAQSGGSGGGNNGGSPSGSGSGGGNSPPPPPPDPKTMRVATFNGGLAPSVFAAKQRESYVKSAVNTAVDNLDVLCVQEFFEDRQLRELYDTIKSKMPYFASAVKLDGSPTMDKNACSNPVRLAALGTCAANNCQAEMDTAKAGPTVANGTAAAKCMANNCAAEMLEMNGNSPACYSCIFFSVTNGTDINYCATTESRALRWDNSYGVAVFSRYPIVQDEFFRVPTFLGVRGVATGRLQPFGVDWGTVGFACAHLTGNHTGGYFGVLDSWVKEQNEQLKVANTAFFKKANSAGGTLFMGDLNMGPTLTATSSGGASSTTLGENEINYVELMSTGGMTGGVEWKNPYIADAEASKLTTAPCTFCGSSNVLSLASRKPMSWGDDVAIDHILATPKLASNATKTERLFDDQTAFPLSAAGGSVTYNGQTYTSTSESDHYGVATHFRIYPQGADKENAAPSMRAVTATSVAGVGAMAAGVCWAANP